MRISGHLPCSGVVIDKRYMLFMSFIRREAVMSEPGPKKSDKHLFSRFDADLDLLLSMVFEMGGVVESQVVRDDRAIDARFRTFLTRLVTSMMDDTRTISIGLDYLFIAKAIERIGDHAKNIA